jgi:nitrogen regulatory protein PII
MISVVKSAPIFHITDTDFKDEDGPGSLTKLEIFLSEDDVDRIIRGIREGSPTAIIFESEVYCS